MSWGVSEPPEVIFTMDAEGAEYKTFDTLSGDTSKRFPKFTVEEFVELAGSSLDERNELTVSQNFTGEFPLYRITVGVGAR